MLNASHVSNGSVLVGTVVFTSLKSASGLHRIAALAVDLVALSPMVCCGSKSRDPNAPPPVLTPRQEGAMDRLCKLTNVMDISLFTVCGKGIGFDGILGFLLPEVGDVITFGVALYTMSNIFCHFNPVFRRYWCTMFMNIGIDLLIGLIPLAGDLCDFYWHSYEKNTDIVRKFYGLDSLSEFNNRKKEEAEAAAAAEHAAQAEATGGDVELGNPTPNGNENSATKSPKKK